MNPMALRAPPAPPIPKSELPRFRAAIAPIVEALEGAATPTD